MFQCLSRLTHNTCSCLTGSNSVPIRVPLCFMYTQPQCHSLPQPDWSRQLLLLTWARRASIRARTTQASSLADRRSYGDRPDQQNSTSRSIGDYRSGPRLTNPLKFVSQTQRWPHTSSVDCSVESTPTSPSFSISMQEQGHSQNEITSDSVP
ncbi:hypothetical protein GE21DRAFT_1055160 [Neurospora crassa]|nr:hypothetical protein GE21DRAFT_1055160 [Neurospora crassa]